MFLGHLDNLLNMLCPRKKVRQKELCEGIGCIAKGAAVSGSGDMITVHTPSRSVQDDIRKSAKRSS